MERNPEDTSRKVTNFKMREKAVLEAVKAEFPDFKDLVVDEDRDTQLEKLPLIFNPGKDGNLRPSMKDEWDEKLLKLKKAIKQTSQGNVCSSPDTPCPNGSK